MDCDEADGPFRTPGPVLYRAGDPVDSTESLRRRVWLCQSRRVVAVSGQWRAGLIGVNVHGRAGTAGRARLGARGTAPRAGVGPGRRVFQCLAVGAGASANSSRVCS
ncbi:hypothetical protein GCM10020229_51890 [Kitasatospora albolonga]